jgi:dipeptidyl aminopeptidase/acylaminoacyl peptidase
MTRARIQLLHADGSARRSLTPLAKGVSDHSPRWSPDGSRLAFARFAVRGERLTSSIVVHDLRTGAEHTVASQRLDMRFEQVWEPDWSADGRLIIYTRSRLDRRSYFRPSLYVVGADGTGRRLLAREAHSAAFSPDGTQIAFASVRDRNGTTCGVDECSYNGELYVMQASGANPRRLTRNAGNDGVPDWSLDGSRIAFSSTRNFPEGAPGFDGTASELYSIRPDGGCLTWLTNGAPPSSDPDWRPGGMASSDPRGCGATPRRPLIETDLREATRFERPRPLWLGRTFRGLLLTSAGAGREQAFFGYDDCGRYHPRTCPGSLQVSVSSVCSEASHLLGLTTIGLPLLRRRGALVVDFGEGDLRAYTGGLEVVVFSDGLGRGAHAAFRGLRPFPHEGARGRLPPPALPRRFVRKLRRVVAAHRRLGSVPAVAEELGLSRARVRRRLAVARALRSFGRLRTVRCR